MKKYIIAIKLKKDQYERYYYDKERTQFDLHFNSFQIISNGKSIYFDFKEIEYFRIIEQGE